MRKPVANYILGDNIILRSYYRFYKDNWGIRSHTAELEVPVKPNPFLSISPFYRYYTQTAVKYFKDYEKHTTQDVYYTSNYDLSKFNSSFFWSRLEMASTAGFWHAAF